MACVPHAMGCTEQTSEVSETLEVYCFSLKNCQLYSGMYSLQPPVFRLPYSSINTPSAVKANVYSGSVMALISVSDFPASAA